MRDYTKLLAIFVVLFASFSGIISQTSNVHTQAMATTLLSNEIPSITSCLNGAKPMFILHMGKMLSTGNVARTESKRTIEECSYFCETNKDSSGGSFPCAGYEYDSEASMCRLVSKFQPQQLQTSTGPSFYQKSCVESSHVCNSPYTFEMVPQKILVGYAKQVVSSASVSECWKSCLESIQNFGFECRSAMFYTADKDCILNTETRFQRPDLFVEETSDSVIYFDNNCAATCSGDTVMQYTKSENTKIYQGITLHGYSFQACAYLCTHGIGPKGHYNCKSFSYNAAEKKCHLSDDRLEPMGRSKLVEQAGFDYYEKQCYTESEGFKVDYFDITCLDKDEDRCYEGTTSTSIRIANAEISGTVNNTIRKFSGSAASCLQQCRDSFPETCRSVTHNSDNGQCQLMFVNSLSSPIESKMNSDYYELQCIPGDVSNCVFAFDQQTNKESSGTVLKAYTHPVALPDCLSECLNTQDCNGANYDHENGHCELLKELAMSKESATKSTFTRVCGAGEIQTICNFDGMKVKVTKESPFTGAVFVKMKYDTCRVEVKDSNMAMLHLGFPLSAAEAHKVAQPCPGGACESNLRDKRQTYTSPPPLPSTPQPQPTVSAAYGFKSTQPPLPNANGLKPNVHRPKGQHKLLPPPTLPIRDCGLVEFVNFISAVFDKSNNGTYKATIVVQSNNLGIPGLVTSQDDIYEVSCDYSSVQAKKVQTQAKLRVEGPTPTHIHPRGKVELSSPVVMNMAGNGQSVLQAKLGEMLELKWEMMIQESNLDFFVKQCVAERGGSPKSPYTTKEDGTKEFTPGYGFGHSNCPNPPCDSPKCTAESCPVDKQPTVTYLKLIEDGCPTPAVASKLMPGVVKRVNNSTKVAPLQAFRFDGSRTVRIICQLDICQGPCKPAVCNMHGSDEASYGRKKRQASEKMPNNLVYTEQLQNIETDEYIVPRRSSALTTFVIVDQQEEEIAKTAARQWVSQEVDDSDFTDVKRTSQNKLRVCFPKSTFIGVSSFLSIVALTQCIAIGIIMSKRLRPSKTDLLM
ncbi:Uncharacterized protein T4D_6680 [Trichinella pseudospiralis]|uniref:Cuticlin-1 n=1 Tax=Trichinella pseudospiralis TaxID=6337 RepID=A0A0V1FEX1_TRIPS|nr:Uncharacterized protein T4D_6680 [Trichinella pseudospiralis]